MWIIYLPVLLVANFSFCADPFLDHKTVAALESEGLISWVGDTDSDISVSPQGQKSPPHNQTRVSLNSRSSNFKGYFKKYCCCLCTP